jgi:hypothetical protein
MYLKRYQGLVQKNKRWYLDEVTSIAWFSKSKYGYTNTTHIN